MSRWRPSLNSTFVIPDIHGNFAELQLILNRILPLRNDKNSKDKLILLGDYIDRGPDSPKVLDTIIELKEKFGDQVVCLLGNHELLMLSAVGRIKKEINPFKPSDYSMWVNNGGYKTIVQYAKRKGQDIGDEINLPQHRAISYIDEKHIDFLQSSCVSYYELDNYIFVHGGCEPFEPLENQDEELLCWDRSLYRFCQEEIAKGNLDLPWEKTIITGHNYRGPFINSKFMMLDCSYYKKLLVVELNSMEAFAAEIGNKRLIKQELSENLSLDHALKKDLGKIRRSSD